MRGARAALAEVVEPSEAAKWPIAVVWTLRVGSDSEAAASEAAARFGDHGGRVHHFVEHEVGIGRAIGKSLGWNDGIGGDAGAWDIYLYYGADQRWTDGPPRPIAYAHQLGQMSEDASFATGDALAAALRRETTALLAGDSATGRQIGAAVENNPR